VPDGRRVTEVEFTLVNDREPERAALYYGSKGKIDGSLRADYIDEPHEDQVKGVLRALHLDENWLEVITGDNIRQRCDIEHEVLDDVVGPMVNQHVVVSGRWESTPRRTRFRLFDIELDTSQSDGQINGNSS
jgi:hypothetical protein